MRESAAQRAVRIQDAACPREVALSISAAAPRQVKKALRGWLKAELKEPIGTQIFAFR